MTMDSLDERIKEALLKTPQDESDPYYAFGFRNFDSFTKPELEKLYVGHEDEVLKVVNHAISVFKNKAPTRRIAIIAPSGTGKTTFSQFVETKLKKFEDMIDIDYSIGFRVKHTPRSILKEQLRIFRKIKNALIVIDDMHEVFMGEEELKNLTMSILSEKIEGGLIITTWLPFGWVYAMSEMPELENMFDDIIILSPISNTDCKKLIKLRFEHFSIQERTSLEPFGGEELEYIIKLSRCNPELLLHLIEDSMCIAHKAKSKNIEKKHIDQAFEEMGGLINSDKINFKDVLGSTLKASLFQLSISADVIAKILKQESSRANYSVYLNKLTEKPYSVMEICKHSHRGKKTIFHVKPIIRHTLESNIMEELTIKSIHR